MQWRSMKDKMWGGGGVGDEQHIVNVSVSPSSLLDELYFSSFDR